MKKHLLTGSSHTCFHDMPEMVMLFFALHTGDDVFPVTPAKGGMALRRHTAARKASDFSDSGVGLDAGLCQGPRRF